jgi:hypothetical protein
MPFLVKKVASIALLTAGFFAFSPSFVSESKAILLEHFPFAHIEFNCEPVDNLVLQFYFTLKQRKCGKYKGPFVMISVNGDLPKSAPQDYLIGSDIMSVANASRCLKQERCETATSGTLHLTKFSEGKGASGEYELHFQDGTVEKGTFDAAWCITSGNCP